MWEEVDPSTADALRDVDAEFRRKEEMLAALHARVEDERLGQEASLREFRARQQHLRKLLPGLPVWDDFKSNFSPPETFGETFGETPRVIVLCVFVGFLFLKLYFYCFSLEKQ